MCKLCANSKEWTDDLSLDPDHGNEHSDEEDTTVVTIDLTPDDGDQGPSNPPIPTTKNIETDVVIALELNKIPGLTLVRPTVCGRGDFIAKEGSGYHIDMKRLCIHPNTVTADADPGLPVEGVAQKGQLQLEEFVNKIMKVLTNLYKPYVFIYIADYKGNIVPEEALLDYHKVVVTVLGNMLAEKLNAEERAKVIYFPFGPDGAPFDLPAALLQDWDGPEETDINPEMFKEPGEE